MEGVFPLSLICVLVFSLVSFGFGGPGHAAAAAHSRLVVNVGIVFPRISERASWCGHI